MAAKKLQEYVKGRITSSNVGSIHFSSNGNQDKTFVNISKFQQSLIDKESPCRLNEMEPELFNSPDQKLQFIPEVCDDSNVPTPSSTKSSPDSKPKWGSHITDVKKNINNAVEDAYSVLNTLLKEHINKSDIKPYQSDTSNIISTEKQQPSIRVSKTMSNIDKISIDETSNDISTYNKSLDNLSVDNELSEIGKSHDSDTVDFKWFPTPKNIKRKSHKTYQKNESYIPKKVQKSIFENHKFPNSKIESAKEKDLQLRWSVFLSILVFAFSMFLISFKIFLGFALGIMSCFAFMFYFGLLIGQNKNSVVSLPALKDLCLPSLPHIQKDNFEDHDIHSTEDSSFSGWMNLLLVYDVNTYNINHCCGVHVDIEPDKQLRIRRPKRKIPRHVIGNKIQIQQVIFSSEIIINLENATLELLPRGLVKKRLWSKKYPIYIELPKMICEYCPENLNFEGINPNSNVLYLFGRTCREKEEWFRRLLYSSGNIQIDLNMWNIVQTYLTFKKSSLDESANLSSRVFEKGGKRSLNISQSDDESRKVTYHNINKEEDDNQEPSVETHKWKQEQKLPQLAEYVKYMAKFMPADLFVLTSEMMRLDINYVTCSPEILCINAFLGRLFWDFLRGSHWVEILQNKIQCKLKKIHLPQFIDELTVVDIHLGKEIPLIRKFGRPYLDSRGLWCDAEVAYTGGFSMILETKINLFNLRNQIKKSSFDEGNGKIGSPEHNPYLNNKDEDEKSRSQSVSGQIEKTAALNSSEEDSAESSSDSEGSGDESKIHEPLWLEDKQIFPVPSANIQVGSGSSKRIIRWVDKIARSSYFIKAVDNKYIQRGMELVANTKLMLQVEVHFVSGTLALNIPPPPSDRLWYGFRPNPILKMSAKPKVGQKEISISKITELIEKKLIMEFQKILVLPNMDDIPLPLLINGSVENYGSNL